MLNNSELTNTPSDMKALKPRTSLRTFIAIKPDAKAVARLYHDLDRLKGSLNDDNLRWIPVQNWHITLAFLGNKTLIDIDLLTTSLAQVSENHSPFTLTFSRFDWFPSLFKAKVLAYIAQPSDDLSALMKSINNAARPSGKQQEANGICGHLSVARPKQKPVTPITSLLTCNTESWVDEFSIFESKLSQNGARYREIERFKLKIFRLPGRKF